MDHHFVVAESVGNMSLTRRWLITEGLQLSPSLLLYVEFVDVAERVFLTIAGSTKHDQAVVHVDAGV